MLDAFVNALAFCGLHSRVIDQNSGKHTYAKWWNLSSVFDVYFRAFPHEFPSMSFDHMHLKHNKERHDNRTIRGFFLVHLTSSPILDGCFGASCQCFQALNEGFKPPTNSDTWTVGPQPMKNGLKFPCKNWPTIFWTPFHQSENEDLLTIILLHSIIYYI